MLLGLAKNGISTPLNCAGLIPKIVASSKPSLSNPLEVTFKLDTLLTSVATASTLAVRDIPRLLL